MTKNIKYTSENYAIEIIFSNSQKYNDEMEGISFVYVVDWVVKTAANMEQFKGLKIVKVVTNIL